ncbi:hypothetical protein Leryth_025349 [Lithospermum erythrorhizon]|nr:hypothetical protein Leryth_025349 [Lithospermum erythrorhizon]
MTWISVLIKFCSATEMNSSSAHFVTPNSMLYEPVQQTAIWGDFSVNGFLNPPSPFILEVDGKLSNQSEDSSHGMGGILDGYNQDDSKRGEKVSRRLAQNREAARKSRIRKKAYVQQLENSKIRLLQLEQELERAKQQGQFMGGGIDVSHLGYSGNRKPGIEAFEVDHGHWVEEQNRQTTELRNALKSHSGEIELRILVDSCMSHYFNLFHMKATAAKADAFYIMSGMWKSQAERFFLWIGGFRPSELLKILIPRLETLTEQQQVEAGNLKQSCHQAEDALSQGMEKLQQILASTISAGELGEGNYLPQMGAAMEKLEALVRVLNQADHLRQETLQQLARILTTRQAARALLALGEYFERLRALSSLWCSNTNESA